ncbi:MFS transporter [Rhodococcus sp. T2V]|uniref:MFS transporter n=1 Tax=Rhodococcus sp. T2V TaxID=3034164 RepID=UPI0023E25619|nr:MFS transporter [Rhodococcus sp. T2V]MDF3312838.1 MFS transporter [Rhodococcus sp. T2V]
MASNSIAEPTPSKAVEKRSSHRRTLVGTGFGNALEWFDWSIYSTFAPFFAASFFNADDPVSAFLAAAVVFAVGFIARPVGAILFGRLGDRVGRRNTLSITVALIALGSLIIGISPSYQSIGVVASVILIVARLIQGLAYGGEQPTAGAYLSELAPAERRGLWSTLVYGSGTAGALVGTSLGAIMSAVFGSAAMYEWGWRVPFIIAGIGGVFALYVRQRMEETEQFTTEIKTVSADAAPRSSMWRDMWMMRRSALMVIGMGIGLTVAYYYWLVATTSYSIAVLQADPTSILLVSLVASLLFIALLPAWGILSDKIGRRPVQLIGIIGTAALLFPLSGLIDGNPWHLLIALSIANVFLSAPCAISPAVMAELFPTRVRTAGIAIPLAIATSLFGGTALYLNIWLTTSVGPNAFLFYVLALLVISGITVFVMPETKGRILNDDADVFTGATKTIPDAVA